MLSEIYEPVRACSRFNCLNVFNSTKGCDLNASGEALLYLLMTLIRGFRNGIPINHRGIARPLFQLCLFREIEMRSMTFICKLRRLILHQNHPYALQSKQSHIYLATTNYENKYAPIHVHKLIH